MGYDDDGELTNIVERAIDQFPIAFYTLNWTNSGRVQWEFKGPLPHPYTPPSRTMTFDNDNRLSTFNGSSVTIDADGDLTYGPGTNNTFGTYTYDARNELTSAGGLSYGYDPAGNRTSLTNGTNIAVYVVDPKTSQVLMRIKGSVTNYYVYGSGLLYESDETATATNTAYYHYDSRGSTITLTDSNGNPTDIVEYSPYGTTTYRYGTNDTPFLYDGQFGVQTDPNGLLYMRARYYNPYISRFINADPSGFAGGLNFYAFCNDNPINLEDPFGLGAVGADTGTSWLSQLNLYGTMSDLGAAGFQQGGVLGSLQGNFYSGATALLNTLGGQAVGITAALSGTAAGNGNTGAAIGWGTASVGLIALNAYTGGQSAAAVGNLGTYAANPILYEIGSKTLPTTVYDELGLEGMSQIDKGAIITDQLYGGKRSFPGPDR
jgi:RHS repeat-associated protein